MVSGILIREVKLELLEYSHNTILVIASLAVSLMSAFCALSLLQDVLSLDMRQKKQVICLSATVLGGGIWAMHFVAMQGLEIEVMFYYDLLYTISSALVSILFTGSALLILCFLPRTNFNLAIAGFMIGVGVLGLHYIGTMGMVPYLHVFSTEGIVSTVFVAIIMSILSVAIFFGSTSKYKILFGTIAFGTTVFLIHFTAMLGTSFILPNPKELVGSVVSNEIIAIGVAIASFFYCGGSLLFGISYLTSDSESDENPQAKEAYCLSEIGLNIVQVPYERNGQTQFLDSSEIAAIRAEGHYTYIYNDSEKLFCPWSISKAEKQLDGSSFLRTHRSYLVNELYVTDLKRLKDSAICYFGKIKSLESAPVSRARLGKITKAIKSRSLSNAP